MKKNIVLLCCLIALGFQAKADNHNTPPPAGSQQQNDKRQADEERQRQEAEDRAMNAEAHQTVTAVGTSSTDCMNSLAMKMSQTIPSVVAACNNDARPIRECFVVSQNVTEPASSISGSASYYEYDETKSDEATCRDSAISGAESKAVSDCQSKYGVSCELTSQGNVFDYHTEEKRRYWLFGPHDLHQICQAAASAAPSAPYTTQCALEIVAKSHY